MIDPLIRNTKAWQYAEMVRSGETVACQWIIKAAERFHNDLKRPDLIYDLNEVERFTQFWEDIAYVPELRKPSILPPPYALAFQQLYGFKYKATGQRRFTDLLIEVGRKNIKTFSSAVISLYELLCGDDPYPYILHGANSRDQALYCTNMSGKVVNASPELRSLVDSGNINMYTNKEEYIKITYSGNGRSGAIEAIPRDLGDGGNPSQSVIDEYHEATTNKLVETIKSGQGARVQPINTIISSPGHNQDGPLYANVRDLAIKMLNGDIEDDRKLALIFEQDNEDDWDNPEMIEKANPMDPYIPTIRPYVIGRIKEAKREGGFTETSVKIKNCGVWVDAADVWIEKSIWIANNDPKFKKEDLKGLKCWGGLDLSATRDLTSFCALFEVELHGQTKYPLLNWNWCPEQYRSRIDYTKWIKEGYINTTPDNHIDQSYVFRDLEEIFSTYNFMRINYDKHMAEWLAPMMSKTGIEVQPLGMQGYAISQSMKEFERLVLGKKIIHFGNPVLTWANSNTMPKRDAKDNIQLTKQNEYNKIDPIVAAVLSVDSMLNYKAIPQKEAGMISL